MGNLNDLTKIEMGYVHQAVLYNRSRKEIAVIFNRSFETVCCQMKNIYRKMEINSLPELCQQYYAEVFHIGEKIEEKKKEINAGILSLLMLVSLTFDHQDIYIRTRRSRRKTETVSIESPINIHGT